MVRLLSLLTLLSSCTSLPVTPTEPVKPEPAPTPVVEKPDPLYVPSFGAPDVVPVGTPFTVWLCGQPWAPGLQVKANGHLLGTMAHHRLTDCSFLIVPGLNTPGIRLLEAGLFERQIFVWDASNLPKR
jgi:hypothetical protein